MQLSQLAAKQKRAHDWGQFIQKEVHSEDLRARFVKSLNTYRAQLARCWEQGEINQGDLHVIQTTERELEQLDEQARLTNPAEK